MAYYKYTEIQPFEALVPDTTASGIVFSNTNNEVAGVTLYTNNPIYVDFDDNAGSSGFYIDNVVVKTLTTPDEGVRIAKISVFAPSGQVVVRGYSWA